MNRCLVRMSLLSCAALLALSATAQSAKPSAAKTPGKLATANKPATAKPASDNTKTQTAAVTAKHGAATTVATTVAVAGSVIILADGIVANAAIAQIQPPADGFEYER